MKRAAAAGGTSPVLSLSSREATVPVLAFLVGGVVGWIYETLICAPMAGREINWMHGGMGIPFLTIYAVGAFLIASLLGPRLAGREGGWRRVLVQFIAATLLCTAVEYATGFVNYSAFQCRASRRFRSRFALQRGMSPTARRKQSQPPKH